VLSVTTDRFRKAFARLPIAIQDKAKRSYLLWQTDPYHPSLNFKLVYSEKQIYSVRIGISYRALGLKEDDTLIWFWIGSHEDYNNLINRL
jgi:hypothetical protein